MNQKELAKVKKQLLEQKEELEKQLASFAEKKDGDYESRFPDYGETEDDNATEVSVFADRLSLEGNLEDSLRQISRAMTKIKEKTYGRCDICHQSISKKRLKIFPSATLCLDCRKKNKGGQ